MLGSFLITCDPLGGWAQGSLRSMLIAMTLIWPTVVMWRPISASHHAFVAMIAVAQAYIRPAVGVKLQAPAVVLKTTSGL